MKRLLTISLALMLSFSFSFLNVVTVSAAKTEAKAQAENSLNYYETSYSSGNSMNLYVESSRHSIGGKIDLIIYTGFSNDIIDISFQGDGFTLTSDFEIVGTEIYFSVTHLSENEKPTLSTSILLDNGDSLFGNLFGIIRDEQLFVNPHSYSLAQNAYLKYIGEYDAKIKMLDNLKKSANLESLEFLSSSYEMQFLSTDENTSVIKGNIEWTDANGVAQPLRFCKIEFYERYTDTLTGYIGEIYTDKDGNYSFEFIDDTIDVTIILYAQGTDVTVCDDSGFDYWYWIEYEDEASLKSISPGSVITIDRIFNIPDDYEFGVDRDYFPRALQVAQAGICASMYYEAMKGTDVEDVSISYPHSIASDSSYYRTSTNIIFLAGNIGQTSFTPFSTDGLIDSFESWDVITHEYGHHVAYCEGIYDSLGGWHVINEDMAEHYIEHFEGVTTNCGDSCALKSGLFGTNAFSQDECKYVGNALAWSEGFATFFGELSQQYFNDNYIDDSWQNEIPTFADLSYYAYNFSTPFDVSAIPVETNNRFIENSELCVQRVLHDLYDGSDLNNPETFDKVNLGHQTIWNYIIDSQAKTLYQFIEYLKNSDFPNSQLTNLGAILEAHGLATEAPTISSFTSDNPYVEFIWDEVNENGYYNARKFQVNFYDKNYSLIGSTTPQVVDINTENVGTITVDSQLWQTIIIYPSNFFVSVTMYECNGNINNSVTDEYTTSYESAYTMYFSPGHVHDYTYSHLKYTSSQHKSYCLCGDFIYESHFFVSGLVYPSCRDCGYVTTSIVPIIKPTAVGISDDEDN